MSPKKFSEKRRPLGWCCPSGQHQMHVRPFACGHHDSHSRSRPTCSVPSQQKLSEWHHLQFSGCCKHNDMRLPKIKGPVISSPKWSEQIPIIWIISLAGSRASRNITGNGHSPRIYKMAPLIENIENMKTSCVFKEIQRQTYPRLTQFGLLHNPSSRFTTLPGIWPDEMNRTYFLFVLSWILPPAHFLAQPLPTTTSENQLTKIPPVKKPVTIALRKENTQSSHYPW